ncbi:carboxypeptidase regulatory-like domain-containing protein [bacterium]|nr:carboxypeptidase regulatory-like domain-containing protein [bacterium]
MSHTRNRALAFALALAAAGCSGKPAEKPVFKVRGRVTYETKPMAKALVSFYAADQKDRDTPAHATADEDGRYVLHTYRADDGAPQGEYLVTIYWPAPRPKAAPKGEYVDPVDADQLNTIDRLKNKYSSVGVTKLRARVEPRDNEIDFNLP